MTTNNHPAHGPVSLDRLHQIREILSKASAQSDGGNLGYAMADAVKVIDAAIAALDAEPVIVVGDDGADALSYRRLIQSFAPGTKLYTTPPATVVPDGYIIVPIVPTEDMIINGFESVPNPHFSDEKEWEEYEALSGCRQASRRAELCWAAMIKAAQQQK